MEGENKGPGPGERNLDGADNHHVGKRTKASVKHDGTHKGKLQSKTGSNKVENDNTGCKHSKNKLETQNHNSK